jgi:hypothetical protein
MAEQLWLALLPLCFEASAPLSGVALAASLELATTFSSIGM